VTVGLRYTTEDKEVTSSFRNTGGAGFACGAAAANPAGTVGALVARGILGGGSQRGRPHRGRAHVPALAEPGLQQPADLSGADRERVVGHREADVPPTDDLMTYLSYARGYKSGGFNLDRVQSANGLSTGRPADRAGDGHQLPRGFVDSWELGAKTSVLSDSLLLNATIFHQTFEQFQLNTFLGTTFIVESIPEVTSQGVDADVVWFAPIEGADVPGRRDLRQDRVRRLHRPDAGADAAPGRHVSFAPEWSASGSLTYEREVGNLLARVNVGAKYNSEFNTGSDLLPAKMQEAFTMFNGRFAIGRRTSGGRWSSGARTSRTRTTCRWRSTPSCRARPSRPT
jgi:outer membrane receptor protein involved in Fe transport